MLFLLIYCWHDNICWQTIKKGGVSIESDNEKMVQLGVRIPEELARKFRVICAAKGIKQQFILEKSIEKFVEENEKSVQL